MVIAFAAEAAASAVMETGAVVWTLVVDIVPEIAETAAIAAAVQETEGSAVVCKKIGWKGRVAAACQKVKTAENAELEG